MTPVYTPLPMSDQMIEFASVVTVEGGASIKPRPAPRYYVHFCLYGKDRQIYFVKLYLSGACMFILGKDESQDWSVSADIEKPQGLYYHAGMAYFTMCGVKHTFDWWKGEYSCSTPQPN